MGREQFPPTPEENEINDGAGMHGVSSRRFDEAFDLVKKIKKLNGEDPESED